MASAIEAENAALKTQLDELRRKNRSMSRKLVSTAEMLGKMAITSATQVTRMSDGTNKEAVKGFAMSCSREADQLVKCCEENQS